jgi:uncharacterized membrane protein
MSNLKEDHAYLYKRVRLKAIMHVYIGLVFMLFPVDADPKNGALSTVQHGIGDALVFIGGAYLLIGVLIAIGTILSRRNYAFARSAMSLATIFNAFWVLLILLATIQHNTRGLAYVLGLSGYLAYNCLLIWKDPGWAGIRIVKQMESERG